MKRRAYKPLWIAADARARDEQDKRKAVERELHRIRALLAKEGEKLIPTLNDGNGVVELAPLPFECVASMIQGQARFSTDEEFYGGVRNYAWRSRPITRTAQ